MGRPLKQKRHNSKYLPILFTAGENRVTQSNISIQKSYGYGNLSLTEFKAVSYLISKVRPDDAPDKIYSFNCGEFLRLIGSHDQSFTRIKRILQNIADTSWWMPAIDDKTGEEKLTLIRFLNIVDIFPGSGIVKISFHERMYPVLHKTQENQFMSNFRMRYIARMTQKTAPLLYRLLNSYKNNTWWTFEYNTGSQYDILPRLVECFNEVVTIPSSWTKFGNFKKDVLDKDIAEINNYTDLYVDYTPLKTDLSGNTYRKVVAIKFFIEKKNTIELNDLDDKYMEIARNDGDVQDAEDNIIKKRQQIVADLEERVQTERENRSQYPTLTSELSEFSDKEIDSLSTAALKNLEPGRIDAKHLDLWLCDYIGHYKQIVDATPEDTKTTPYKRLFNLVKNDYDSQAVFITRYDKEKIEKITDMTNADLTEKFAGIRNIKLWQQ